MPKKLPRFTKSIGRLEFMTNLRVFPGSVVRLPKVIYVNSIALIKNAFKIN